MIPYHHGLSLFMFRWNLKIKDKLTGQENEETFDAVMDCTGLHGSVHWPKFPGSEEFQVCKNKIICVHIILLHICT